MSSRLCSLILSLFLVAPLCVTAAPTRPNLVYPLQAQRPPVARTSQTWTWTLLPGTFNASSGSIITLSTRSLPTWASFDAATYTFSGMPTAEDVGTQYVTVQANVTGVAQGKTDSFRLLVVDGSGPAVGLSLAVQLPNASSFGGGATYTADGALLVPPTWSFSLGFQQYTFQTTPYSQIYYTAYQTGTTELPYWLHFDNTTVTFDGVAPRQLGEVSITVFGSDHYGYGDLSESFQLQIGYHAFELLGSLPAINTTQGGNVSYVVPLTNLTIDDQPVTSTNLSSIQVDLSNTTFLSYDAASRLISGTVPPTFAPGTFALPITFVDSYTEKIISNVTLVVGASPVLSTTSSGVGSKTSSGGGAGPTSISGGGLAGSGGLSNSSKLAIGLTVGLVGGILLLVLLLACCRRRSDKRKMRRDHSTLIFDQATIAAAQRGALSEKSTGKSTFAAKFGMAAPSPSTGRTAVESPASNSIRKETTQERIAAAAAAAPPPLTTASSKPRRLNLMGMLGRPAPKRDISTISLPVPQSQHSLFGLGIGDAPPPHHNIVVVTDDYTETFVPEAARGTIVTADSGLHRTSSWESRGSSSLFYSEGSDNDVPVAGGVAGGSNRRRYPTPDPSVPRQRRDFLPLPIRTSSQQAASLPHDTSFTQGSSSSSITAPASDGGIRLVESQPLSHSDSQQSELNYSSSSLRDDGNRPPYDPSSDSGHSIPPPRLIPFTKERAVSQVDPDPYRQASPASQRAQRNRDSAMEDADEDAYRARPRSAVYLPPRETGSPTTSAVYFATQREGVDEWSRSPSMSEYEPGEGVRLVSSGSGSPHPGVGRSSHTDSSYIRFNPQVEQGDDGEYRVVTY